MSDSGRRRRGKTVTHSFRIDEEWDRGLREEAHRQGISVNSLVNKIFRDYSVFQRYADRLTIMILGRNHLVALLETVTEEYLVDIAERIGSTSLKNILLMTGRALDFHSMVWALEEAYGEPWARWFDCDHHTHGNQHIFYLRHYLGMKWSVYVASFVTSAFKSVIGVEPEVETSDRAVTVTIEYRTPVIRES